MPDTFAQKSHEEDYLAPETVSPLRNALSVLFFILAVAGAFISLGWYVTDIQGGGVSGVGAGVSAERGEGLFWGDASCHTCHSIGERGSMTRCPNLGESSLGPPIGERAALRAKERTDETGIEYTPVSYLVECISNPSAYVVDGFPDKLMPLVYTGQIDLEPDEVMSVIAYLKTIGGETDLVALTQAMSRFGQNVLQKDKLKTGSEVIAFDLPYPEWEVFEPEQFAEYHNIPGEINRAAYRDSTLDEEQMEIYDEIMEEWIQEGEAVYDAKKCWQCHLIDGKNFGELEPGKVGPNLTGLGAIQSREYMIESIINPDALVVPPLKEHTAEGRSKMPNYVDQLAITDLMKLAVFLSVQVGQPADTTVVADTLQTEVGR